MIAISGVAQQQTKELHVAAAADLQPVLPALAHRYEKATGIKLVISYGSSGNLTTQIINGAPMDLFLGADFVFPEKVVAAGLADGTAPTQYARGTLVLWARKDSPLQPITLDSLTDKRVTAVAIANDLRAPYGQAAVAAMKHLKVYDIVKPHLVVAENIAQAAQFVESGNAQLGLISLTAASTPRFKSEGTFVRVPTSSYPPIMQCAVVMAKSNRRSEAHAFLNWLLKPEVQASLVPMGLEPVK
ncbi:molybdate ABC transporter substrate-binding protein [Edaphobacter albus]|uniref:molybdate ABC transporter substrate-binding protein n=1 Tax=Edaphobacter sp. 4G125 TaxID=2763071 RepID=UPI00210452F0|nr:molybdate ABC transporter substrate-binding protein [Edaphobacter sp. 4G125]